MKFKKILLTAVFTSASFLAATSHAGVVGSDTVLTQIQGEYSKQQLVSMVSNEDVLAKLEALGVDAQTAQTKISQMTNSELLAFNQQLNDAPAGGIVGTAITVFIVLAVLDLLGVTDLFTFIDPIN
ncbi:PA2779 family protein [Psychrosphaera aquimarina]|uniref:PA2779 family protein n=1 Tax=Psychrosphaera aquimarina TaxID=2044854 RepID=A0ABU3R0P0_9GAMM|nr:PA2779 family protein [Psychrosphaera aquimarina]MDU0112985.1 PA2779 family protein [Psychrosphaera aquimarina]